MERAQRGRAVGRGGASRPHTASAPRSAQHKGAARACDVDRLGLATVVRDLEFNRFFLFQRPEALITQTQTNILNRNQTPQ
jgi:hypothetical protein